MANFVITRAGWFLASQPGWGPTTTNRLDQAKRFNTIHDAYEYRRNHDFFEKYSIGRVNMWGHVEPVA